MRCRNADLSATETFLRSVIIFMSSEEGTTLVEPYTRFSTVVLSAAAILQA